MKFTDKSARVVAEKLVETIQDNKSYLSEIDGAIGDGDHGINMAKGFSLSAEKFTENMGLSESLKTVGRTLVMEIGGAMGPLYGSFFKAMSKACGDREDIDAQVFEQMLAAALSAVAELGSARVGDKTMIDTLNPAVEAFRKARSDGLDFKSALLKMSAAAERGKESTKNITAKVGRASRLGERSKGKLDAGAVSCYLILASMADSVTGLLEQPRQSS